MKIGDPITPEILAVLNASRRMFMNKTGGNTRAWRKAENALIKTERAAERESAQARTLSIINDIIGRAA